MYKNAKILCCAMPYVESYFSKCVFQTSYILGIIEPLGNQRHDINVLDSQQSPGSLQAHSEKPKIASPEEILKELPLKIEKTKFSKTDYVELIKFLVKNEDILAFAEKLSDLLVLM